YPVSRDSRRAALHVVKLVPSCGPLENVPRHPKIAVADERVHSTPRPSFKKCELTPPLPDEQHHRLCSVASLDRAKSAGAEPFRHQGSGGTSQSAGMGRRFDMPAALRDVAS